MKIIEIPICALCGQGFSPDLQVGGEDHKRALFGAQKYKRCPNCLNLFPAKMQGAPATIQLVNKWIQERLEPATDGMTIAEIKTMLAAKGIKQIDIARRLRVTPANVYMVIHGIRSTRHVREAIAEALEVPVKRIWPA